jgi:hypothetical protein
MALKAASEKAIKIVESAFVFILFLLWDSLSVASAGGFTEPPDKARNRRDLNAPLFESHRDLHNAKPMTTRIQTYAVFT